MMTARELHGKFKSGEIVMLDPRHNRLILRALDLLARVEESEDELVLELRETYKWRDPKLAELCDKAAALIVAQREELERVKAERDGLLRGEYICRSCDLRKNGELDATPSF